MKRWTLDPHIRTWLPKLQSHRGYWVKGLQQNSLQSIQAAKSSGYEMVEFDVRVTRDGQIILFHDDRFKKRKIQNTTLKNLREQTQITTLEELLQWFAGVSEFKLNIEIKSKALLQSDLELKICGLLKKYGVENRVLISSFNPLSLYRVKKLNPSIYRALLLTFKKEEGNNWFVMSMLANLLCQPHVLHLRYNDFSDNFLQLTKIVPVVLWTVNEIEIYKVNKDVIHGVISDEITPEDFAALN